MIQITSHNLSEDFKNVFKKALELLHEQAPSDSDVRSKIGKDQQGYSGTVEIFSAQGHFFAKATALDIKRLATELLNQMFRQLGTWKRDRFINAVS